MEAVARFKESVSPTGSAAGRVSASRHVRRINLRNKRTQRSWPFFVPRKYVPIDEACSPFDRSRLTVVVREQPICAIPQSVDTILYVCHSWWSTIEFFHHMLIYRDEPVGSTALDLAQYTGVFRVSGTSSRIVCIINFVWYYSYLSIFIVFTPYTIHRCEYQPSNRYSPLTFLDGLRGWTKVIMRDGWKCR